MNLICKQFVGNIYKQTNAYFFTHSFKSCYFTLMILFNISQLFAYIKWFQVFLSNMNNSIQYQLCLHTVK